MHNKSILLALRVTGITVLAFILSFFLASPVSFSVSSIFSSPEKEDTQISDFFAQVANRRPVRVLDPEIVIVDIASADRQEMTSLFEMIGLCDPRAEATLRQRRNIHEIIDYPTREFEVIPIGEVADRADELLRKIILVGALPIRSTPPPIMPCAPSVATCSATTLRKPPPIWRLILPDAWWPQGLWIRRGSINR